MISNPARLLSMMIFPITIKQEASKKQEAFVLFSSAPSGPGRTQQSKTTGTSFHRKTQQPVPLKIQRKQEACTLSLLLLPLLPKMGPPGRIQRSKSTGTSFTGNPIKHNHLSPEDPTLFSPHFAI